jgi:hypothetical protein
VRAFEEGRAMPEPFGALACEIARFQAEHVPGYARLCATRGIDARSIARAIDAPAVPCDAFKLARVAWFDARDAVATFRTSGTTLGARGEHAMRDIATYDAAALAFGKWMLARDVRDAIPVIVLGPSAEEAPDSSLAHMTARFARALGDGARADDVFFVRSGTLDVEALRRRTRAIGRDRPVLVLATSFALVHLLDALAGAALPLPPRSRVMTTGGFKGRSREVDADELRRALALVLGVDERAVVGEYGMTELSSQLYEATLFDGGAHGVFVEPPWARVVPVDPETLAPMLDGEAGLARIEDLMNVDSAFAVLALDRVRRVAGGIELLGRAPGAPPRGCSIAIDEMLGQS